jgi:CheY-like chemotaxis protein
MPGIVGLRVLIVEDDADGRELLRFFLQRLGVVVREAASAAEARAVLAEYTPHVILADIGMPNEDGVSFLAGVRATPATAKIPAIALSAHAEESSRERALAAGFQKFIAKPYDVFALPAAIASVAARHARSSPPNVALDRKARIAALIEDRDMRALLALLNEPTPYRYTSILQCQEGTLESVWTFDRERDGVDAFPSTRLEDSYCVFVEASRTTFATEDSSADPRVATHPKRKVLRSYCGVPLFRADGTVFGTLCHYDPLPHPIDEAAIEQMNQVAQMLAPTLSRS